jgi:hypothetical protein
MISSTIPSAKYSCSGSPLIFAKGSTAMDGLSGKASAGPLSVGVALGVFSVVASRTRYTRTGRAMFLSRCSPMQIDALDGKVIQSHAPLGWSWVPIEVIR